jgi:zinc protease
VAASIAEMVRFNLPDDYFATYPDKVRALTQSEVEQTAADVVQPRRLVWVVVGDRSKIEAPIRALGWGQLHWLDPDGRPVE